MKWLSVDVLYTGLNQTRLINNLYKSGLKIEKIEKLSYNQMLITFPYKTYKKLKLDKEKKVLRVSGILSPFYKLIKNAGVLIGVTLFLALAYFSNGLVYNVSVIGSASDNKTAILQTVKDFGVKKYSKFKDIDFSLLQSALIKNNNLSFVSLEKKGNSLIIKAEKTLSSPPVIDTSPKDIVAKINGEILKIFVYRGTKAKEKGEKVTAGEVLVYGHYYIGEEKFETYPLFEIEILARESVIISLEEGKTESEAIEIASLKYENVVSATCEKVTGETPHFLVEVGYKVKITN